MKRGEGRSGGRPKQGRESEQGAAVLTVEQTEGPAGRATPRDAEAPPELPPAGPDVSGIRLATIVALSPSGTAMLLVPEGDDAMGVAPARSTVVLRKADVGRRAAVMFERGDRDKPIVIGLIEEVDARAPSASAVDPQQEVRASILEIDVQSLLLTAAREIVLRCGEASVTLTRSGKVLIRGKQVLSRASGTNRIKGGSVQIN